MTARRQRISEMLDELNEYEGRRPRLDADLAAAVQAYADANGITFTAATRILLRQALKETRNHENR